MEDDRWSNLCLVGSFTGGNPFQVMVAVGALFLGMQVAMRAVFPRHNHDGSTLFYL